MINIVTMSNFVFTVIMQAVSQYSLFYLRDSHVKLQNVMEKISIILYIKYYYIYYITILDMIHVGNNTESQLEELLGRKERKCIWDLGSMTPYDLCQDDGFHCQNKMCRNR